MTKQKICFIVASPGTALSFLVGHMKRLSTHFEVHLVANFQSEAEKTPFEGVQCHSVRIERKINISNDLMAVWALRKLFKEKQFFAVHSVTPKAGLVTALAGRMAGIQNRIHIYTGQVWATRTGLMRQMLKFFDQLIALLNTHLLVDGYSQRRFLIEHGVLTEKNSLVMGKGSISGVDTQRFKFSQELRDNIRKELGIENDQIVFIFLGRMNHDKGLDELLEAFNRLAEEEFNAYLLFVGFDEEGYNSRARKYENIKPDHNYRYYGRTSHPEKLLHAGDVFVLPSYREGFGTSVIEASSVGLPVICSDTYGVMDAMVDEVTGLRCKVADAASLYDCMKRLYSSPDDRKQLGRAGHERVINEFSAAVVLSAWEDFYMSL